MSDTPETQEAVERWRQGKINIFDEMARLETERNDLLKKLESTEWECVERGKDIETLKSALKGAREERDEARMQYQTTHLLAEVLAKTQVELKKERDEQTAQMCQAIGHLSTVAEDCEAWLNGESDEPSMDFIKAVRDYARKAVNNE